MNAEEYLYMYGPEWELIRRAVKLRANHTCQDCKKTFDSINLDAHHIVPISHFLEEGYTPDGKRHYCFGIPTTRAWHVDPNLEVLCMKCHSKIHPHLVELYKNVKYKRS